MVYFMWKLSPDDEYLRKYKRYGKKHARELHAVMDNLDTFLKALNEGALPQQIKAGFVHVEPMGVRAIDQKGGGAALAETRLYVYPDEERKTLHLITLGDKRSQQNDIARCRRFVAHLRAQEEDHNNG